MYVSTTPLNITNRYTATRAPYLEFFEQGVGGGGGRGGGGSADIVSVIGRDDTYKSVIVNLSDL